VTDYHLWCQPCQKEFSESQAEQREVDGIWGEGRWWFCPTCGTRLEALKDVSPQDQEVLAAVAQMLVRLENKEQVSAEQIHILLLEMGSSYNRNGQELEACLVFYNASNFARQNNLIENTSKAHDHKKIAYQWNVKESQYQISLPEQELMEDYLSNFLPI
jgi:hypothetical protein